MDVDGPPVKLATKYVYFNLFPILSWILSVCSSHITPVICFAYCTLFERIKMTTNYNTHITWETLRCTVSHKSHMKRHFLCGLIYARYQNSNPSSLLLLGIVGFDINVTSHSNPSTIIWQVWNANFAWFQNPSGIVFKNSLILPSTYPHDFYGQLALKPNPILWLVLSPVCPVFLCIPSATPSNCHFCEVVGWCRDTQ